MTQPDISIIIPAHRAASTISKTLCSVTGYHGIDVEIIVVEDGPNDNTKQIVDSFAGVRFISLPVNKGVCYARNIGLANAHSESVLFLDADDLLEGPILEGVVSILRDELVDMVFAPWRFDGPGAKDTSVKLAPRVDTSGWLAAWAAGHQWAWACPSRIGWRKRSLIAIGGWNLGFPRKEDTEIMMRALTSGLRFDISDKGCGVYWREKSSTARSYKFTNEVLRCQWGIYELLRTWLLRNSQAKTQLQPQLGEFCYRVASLAISRGNLSEGKRWLKEAKSLGITGCPGMASRSVLLMALWLKYKPALEWQMGKLRTRTRGGCRTPEMD